MKLGMDDSKVIANKLYLVKGKAIHAFGARDEIWAIGHKGNDPLDFNGLKSLFQKANSKGIFMPFLSTSSITFREVKAKVNMHEMEIVGDPVKLLDNVYTFYEIAVFAYDAGILTDENGRKLLENLYESQRMKGEGKKSMTLKKVQEDARPKASMELQNKDVVIDLTAIEKQSQDLNMERARSSLVQSLSHGDRVLVQRVVEQEPVVVQTHDVENDSMFGIIETTVEGDLSYQVPGIGGEVEVNTENNGNVLGADDVELIAFNLEKEATEESINGWKSKASRYKSLVCTLLSQKKSLKESNVKLVRQGDLNEKKLAEFKTYSASEVLEGLKPSLAPLQQVLSQLGSLAGSVKEMESKMLEKLKENKDEIKEVSAEVCSGVETSQEQSNTVVHHLASRGLVNLGEVYDIPNALSAILEKVKSVADPQTPVLDDRNELEFFGNAENGVKRPMPVIVTRLDSGALDVPNAEDKVLHGTGGMHEGNAGAGQGVSVIQSNSVIMKVVTKSQGAGLLPTPPQYRSTELGYAATRNMAGEIQGKPEDLVTPRMDGHQEKILKGRNKFKQVMANIVATRKLGQHGSQSRITGIPTEVAIATESPVAPLSASTAVSRKLFSAGPNVSRPPPGFEPQQSAKKSRWN